MSHLDFRATTVRAHRLYPPLIRHDRASLAARIRPDSLIDAVREPRRRGDLGIAPAHLASAYVLGVPTTTLLSRPLRAPQRRARFRIPARTPPGVYLVLIFDGSEGGAHNTWDLFHVTGRARRSAAAAATASDSDSTGGRWWIGAGGLLVGLAAGGVIRARAGGAGDTAATRPRAR